MSTDQIERSVVPAVRDLGDGFHVWRALPSAACRRIGPFVFFHQFGPTRFGAGDGLDVRPHPHVGLATLTKLLDGKITHRDSLGVATFSPMGYADVALEQGAIIDFGNEYPQSAVYVVSAALEAGGRRFESAQLLQLRAAERVRFRAVLASRLMLLAGEPLDGPRYVWWNLVFSSGQRIEQAKQRWLAADFGTIPGDARDCIPLPTGALPDPAQPSPVDGDVL